MSVRYKQELVSSSSHACTGPPLTGANHILDVWVSSLGGISSMLFEGAVMTLFRGPSTGMTDLPSRRLVLLVLAGAAIAIASFTIVPHAHAQRPPKRCNPGEPPDQSRFQSGDFLWPKLPGTYQPFASGSAATAAIERAEWMHGRDALVDKLEAEGSPPVRALAAELKDMTFEQFHVRYINGARPGENMPFSSGRLGTGHIGILDIDRTGPPYVIEAMPQLGVQRISYDDWL